MIYRLGRGRYFGRVLTLGLVTCLVAFPLDERHTIRYWVGCEAQTLSAAVFFTGLQCLLTFWSLGRLRDAGYSAWWATLPWVGAAPGLMQAAGHAPAPALQTLLYGAAVAAVLAIGALPPSGRGDPAASETAPGRWWRRGVLIAILAYVMVVVPEFGDATPRGLVIRDYEIALVVKEAVAAAWARTGLLPSSNAEAGLPPPEAISGNTVARVAVVTEGRIVITYDDPRLPCTARGRSLVLVPVVVGGHLDWRCTGGDMPDRYRPQSCRNRSPQ